MKNPKDNRLILDEWSLLLFNTKSLWAEEPSSPFIRENRVMKSTMEYYGEHFGLPNELNEAQQKKAENLLKLFIADFKSLYGNDIPTSYNVASNGATLQIANYMIYNYDDYSAFLDEISGCLSGSCLLDEILMSFQPSSSKIIQEMTTKGLGKVVSDYMPSKNTIAAEIKTSIDVEEIPLQLCQVISKAYLIFAFVNEALESTKNETKLVLTITDLTLDTVIECNGFCYKIEGINDIHNVILGFQPDNLFEDISEDAMMKMYRKLGLAYIPNC